MKTRSYVVGCVLALIGLFAGANMVQAATLIDYDFTSLADGTLVGQDSWATNQAWPSLTVTNGTGAANTDGGESQGGLKPVSLPTFASTNSLVETARFYSIGASDVIAGLSDERGATGAEWLPSFGVSVSGANTVAYFRSTTGGAYTEYYGDVLVAGDTYDVQLSVDLSTAGGLATVAYRNVTQGGGFTTDSSLVNKPMGLTQGGGGEYDFNAISLRIGYLGAGISRFTVTSDVPEPSTMVLLFTGLMGLLAYAWRKRK